MPLATCRFLFPPGKAWTIVGLLFLFFGKFILNVMGISVPEFAIAGGLILLVLSIMYMVTGHMVTVVKEEMVAIVPIGTPLTVGPATITTLLLLSGQYPMYIVLISFIINARNLDFLSLEPEDSRFFRQGRTYRYLPGIQPAAGCHCGEYGYGRIKFTWNYPYYDLKRRESK
jgi:hypothetical protein